MKLHNPETILSALLTALVTFGVAQAASLPVQSPETDTVPKGLNSSDWSSIRAAFEAGLHAVVPEKNGAFSARNPRQQWNAKFDGRGFTVVPDHGGWTWGLELTGYADRVFPHIGTEVGDSAVRETLHGEGGKISAVRDENLTEWFINDTRGLEQGWTFKQRPERPDGDQQLRLKFTVRGELRPQVSADGTDVGFLTVAGGVALSYGGLKAWDADGKILAVRFELEGQREIGVVVNDEFARYPITIDPVVQQAYLKPSHGNPTFDGFGISVGVSGDTVVVGGGSYAPDVSGAAYVFVRSGSTWTQQAFLVAPYPGAIDGFAFSVGISGDTIVLGSHEEDSDATGVNGDQNNDNSNNSGAAYVFVRSGTSWAQQAYLKAHNADPSDIFGEFVAISGDTIVVGAPGEDSDATGIDADASDNSASLSGAAYIFKRSGTTWTQQAYLKASNTETNDLFGKDVAISGNTVVIGAEQEGGISTGINGDQGDGEGELEGIGGASGAAYIFVSDGSTWSQQAYLKSSNSDSGDAFGSSVAVWGDTVVVGAPQEGSSATGVNGDESDDETPGSGAAYVFIRNGITWSQQAYLKASNPDPDDFFGHSVAISGNIIVVGADSEQSNATGVNGDQSDNSGGAIGAAYVFARNGTTWAQQAYLKTSNAITSGEFGWSVAVSCGTVIVGAPLAVQVNEVASGTAYLFTVPLQDFSNAMATAGLTGADALFDADPDKDGLANGLEWILGGNPTSSSLSVVPTLSVDTNDATLTFTRLDISECSAKLKVQWSTDLSTWTDVPVTSVSSSGITVTEAGTAPDNIVVSVPRSNAVSGKIFLRLVAIYTVEG